jgi:hypothetical protein
MTFSHRLGLTLINLHCHHRTRLVVQCESTCKYSVAKKTKKQKNTVVLVLEVIVVAAVA